MNFQKMIKNISLMKVNFRVERGVFNNISLFTSIPIIFLFLFVFLILKISMRTNTEEFAKSLDNINSVDIL